jgi:hypothetical protein
VAIAEGSSSAPPEIIPGPNDFSNSLKDVKCDNNEILLIEKANSSSLFFFVLTYECFFFFIHFILAYIVNSGYNTHNFHYL